MSVLLKSGMSISESLSASSFQLKSDEFKEIMKNIIRDVKSGISLAKSLERQGKYFDTFYCSIVESGEKSGYLPETFVRLYNYLTERERLKKKIGSAMIYPVFLLIFSIAVVFFLSIVVLPSFSKIYESFDRELPFVTKIVMGAAEGIKRYWYVIAGGGGLTWRYVKLLSQKKENMLKIQDRILKIKVVREYVYKSELSVFFSLLSLALKSGMDVVSAMIMAGRNIKNIRIQMNLEQAVKGVTQGVKLSRALSENAFPPLAVQFISAGESSNNLEEVLDNIVEFYKNELEDAVSTFISLIEPVLIVIVGSLVGIIIIAIILPILTLSMAVS
jgi:type IV pilus assembly protein PilC